MFFSTPKEAAILHFPATFSLGQEYLATLCFHGFAHLEPFIQMEACNGWNCCHWLLSWHNIFMVHPGFSVCQYFIPLYSQILHQTYLLIYFYYICLFCVCAYVGEWLQSTPVRGQSAQVSSRLPPCDSWGCQAWWPAPHLTVSPTQYIPDFNYALVSYRNIKSMLMKIWVQKFECVVWGISVEWN